MLGLGAAVLLPLGGCMMKPLQSVNAAGTYCHHIGKSYRPKSPLAYDS